MAKDYYKILGVTKTATEKDVKLAFRRLARRYHPDVNPGDKSAEARFKEINEAHEVLSDPEKRRKFDQYGDQWQYAQHSGGAGQWQQQTGGKPTVDFGDQGSEDLFEQLFRGFGRETFGKGSHRMSATETPVEITLEEAFNGASRILQLGDSKGVPHRLEVKIPPGVNTGSRVRIPGLDNKGEIFMVITVKPHQLFERQGDDLKAEVAIPLLVAVLGGEIEIPTMKGKVALKIPPETQNGKVFRLAGLGMPRAGNALRGDLYAKVGITLPTSLTEREKELFRQLKTLRSY